MSIPITVGQNLILALELTDGDNTKYPLVHVYDQYDAEVGGSPFSLFNVGFGLYTAYPFTAVSGAKFYNAIFVVYEDPGFTQLSIYDNEIETFTVVELTVPITPAQVWTYPTRTLSSFPPFATSTDIANAVNTLTANLSEWTARLSLAIDPLPNTIELLAWLENNGTIVTDADTAIIQVLDGADNVVFQTTLDSSDSSHGVFEFSQPNAKELLLTTKAYVARVSITRASVTYTSLTGLTVIIMANGLQAFSYGTVVVPTPIAPAPSGQGVPIEPQPPAEVMQDYPQIFGFFATYQGKADESFGVNASEIK